MIEILPQSTGNVVALRVNGKLVHQDYQQFVPKLEAILQQYGSMRCYCEMTNFEGITWQAMMDEISFDVKHCNQIERCAMVSDSAWSQWMTDFTKMIFHNAQVECFTSDQTEEAWNWVTEDVEYAGTTSGTSQTNVGGTTGNTTWGNQTGTNPKQGTCGTTGSCGQNPHGNTPNTTPRGQTN